jgi:hypothetical protein
MGGIQEEVPDAHVPESVVELKKREFEELQQNTAPIMHYG